MTEGPGGAVRWQRAEGAILFALGLTLYTAAGAPFVWWAAILLFFVPDLSFAAYLAGPRIGAAGYNLVHFLGFGGALIAIGLLASWPVVAALGALWLGHAGFDRMLGYGLKLPDGFASTHLGRIGRG
ncbi:DUF4260 domain-containing protein [Wenxinia saemankumensis]|uniref:DUF4260 domain-containing protein n=1 Tax=Wenxinia saemankumensis TaxID=1447782 RepID=A0A1M6GPN3_9RHOB|nr:DUF4260 domain-containing protein [Wenxinia saemankumensis]SHJ11868.1 protein of unknown function [Wenxinia saemankumensis]